MGTRQISIEVIPTFARCKRSGCRREKTSPRQLILHIVAKARESIRIPLDLFLAVQAFPLTHFGTMYNKYIVSLVAFPPDDCPSIVSLSITRIGRMPGVAPQERIRKVRESLTSKLQGPGNHFHFCASDSSTRLELCREVWPECLASSGLALGKLKNRNTPTFRTQ